MARYDRSWRRYWIKDPIQGAIDYALHFMLRALPIAWCSAIGGRLGELAGRWRFPGDNRRARANLRRLSPGTDVEMTMRRLWNHLGRTMSEFSVLDRLWRSGRIAVEGAEHLAAARLRGPTLVIAVHVGNWEVVEPVLMGLGCDASMIYQPPRNRFQHRIAVMSRRRFGIGLLKPGPAGTRGAYRVLARRDGVLLVHVDESIRRRVNAPLFGRPALHRSNLTLVARLAMGSGAAVVRAVTERTGGARFRVVFSPAMTLSGDPGAPADLARAVAALDDAVTPWVTAHLDQWLMLRDLDPERG